MIKKIILPATIFLFAVFALAYSYAGYGKTVSENTSAAPDGTIQLCRKFSKVNKVIAIDLKNKSRKTEISKWNFDTETNVLSITEDFSAFADAVFHIEGTPNEPTEFILQNMDLNQGPIGVFLNGKICVENREFTLNEKTKTVSLKVSPKEISSISIVWHTTEGGLASVSEMTQKEADLYAELEGVWFTENAKKQIAALTEYPTLDFSNCIDGTPSASYENGVKPKIVMKKYTQEELKKQLDDFPVNAYKTRHNVNMKKLSKEAGFNVALPQKSGEYKLVSTMLIESSLKGDLTKTLEFSYDKSDFFSLNSITIQASVLSNAESNAEQVEYPISTETLQLKVPVQKQMCWSVSNDGENSYKLEVLCIYTWTQNGTVYKIQCLEEKSQEVEKFIKELF